MSEQFSFRFSGFDDALIAANIGRAARVRMPPKGSPGAFEQQALRTAISAASGFSRVARRLSMLMAPPSAMARVIGSVGSLPIRSPSPDFTVTVGLTASAGAAVSVGGGAGIYYWNRLPSGELGLYGSVSVGMISNIGFGVGDAIAFLFGSAPSTLAGDIIALEIDVGIDIFTVGGQVFITAPPVTFVPLRIGPGWSPEIVGFGLTLTAGMSVLPVNYAITPSRTWIRPLTP
ncbi:MAG: hypothetical protein ACOYNF_17810 [Rhodoferax sp.]|jgi:hypothetical protein|nr:hypothetical protein [Rhodoferax sp.]